MSKRRIAIALGCVAMLCVLGTMAIRAMGTWLVVEDPLQHARSIVVLGGQVPFRAMEAARTYQQGWAQEIWLSQGAPSEDDIALRNLGIEKPAEYVYSRQVLERLGVPEAAIHLLPGPTASTAAEVLAIAKGTAGTGGGRVIVITSKYHARRVRVLWHALIGNSTEAIVRYASDDPFNSTGWWRNTGDATAVVREWLGLFNAWTGFPVSSGR